MSREIALARKAVLEELLHQRLRVGKRDKTVAQIARRDDAELLAQTSRGAAVVRDRHNRRYVARQLLDPAQQYGEAVAAADDRDRRAAAQTSLFIDEINEARRCPLRHQRCDDRAYDVACCHQHECSAEEGDRRPRDCRETVVVTALPRIDEAEDCLLDAVDVFVVENERGSKPHRECPDGKDEEPSLEPHAGIEPFYEVHTQPSLTCSCTSFFMRSRCSRRAA